VRWFELHDPSLHVAGVVPQHPLELLGGQPATEPPPRVLLGSRDERLTEALVEAGAAVVIGALVGRDS
jgi:hypothetical protein